MYIKRSLTTVSRRRSNGYTDVTEGLFALRDLLTLEASRAQKSHALEVFWDEIVTNARYLFFGYYHVCITIY